MFSYIYMYVSLNYPKRISNSYLNNTRKEPKGKTAYNCWVSIAGGSGSTSTCFFAIK